MAHEKYERSAAHQLFIFFISLRQRPRHVREIWKRGFTPAVGILNGHKT